LRERDGASRRGHRRCEEQEREGDRVGTGSSMCFAQGGFLAVFRWGRGAGRDDERQARDKSYSSLSRDLFVSIVFFSLFVAK
jgi:hypothetical protein